MNSIILGHAAPEFSLYSAEGDLVSMKNLRTSGQHTLLIFLRHLG